MFYKIGVLKNFAIYIHRKIPVMVSLFNKVAGLQLHLELIQTPKMELFTKIVNSFQLLLSFAKDSISDICSGSEYASNIYYRMYH